MSLVNNLHQSGILITLKTESHDAQVNFYTTHMNGDVSTLVNLQLLIVGITSTTRTTSVRTTSQINSKINRTTVDLELKKGQSQFQKHH